MALQPFVMGVEPRRQWLYRGLRKFEGLYIEDIEPCLASNGKAMILHPTEAFAIEESGLETQTQSSVLSNAHCSLKKKLSELSYYMHPFLTPNSNYYNKIISKPNPLPPPSSL